VSTRLVILTEIIAPYRIPVFNVLASIPGLHLHVIFLAETDAGLRQWRVYKDEIRFSYEVLQSWRWHLGRKNLLINFGLKTALNKARPNAIICGGYNYAASWQALWWARRREVAFVLWSESNSNDARGSQVWLETLKRYFLQHCDRFVVPGKASFEYLRALGAPPAKIFTAPNAVDNQFFANEAENTRAHAAEFRNQLKLPQRYILFVGRVVPEKGVFDLLEAYARLDDHLKLAVGLVFAGDGVSREELKQRAARISPGTVCFPGFAQREALAGLYALAEVLVLPTHSDPWGLVVNEAMACGLPILVSNVAGCSADLVEDGWNGYAVPPRNVEQLSMAIDSVLRRNELRESMSVHSLERIRKYSPGACADGLAAAAISRSAGA
jgi:1,2-diacylglycerol 3-alpha-glucosyltransferase